MTEARIQAMPDQVQEIRYDPANPSPLFTDMQIKYIRSIEACMTPAEVSKCLALETFELIISSGDVRCEEIPGLREDPDLVVLYVENHDRVEYLQFKDRLLDLVFDDSFLYESRKYVTSTWRLSTPSGAYFYPFVFGSQEGKWRRLMLSAASEIDTRIGEFRKGKFGTFSGELYSFKDLNMEKMDSGTDLTKW